LHKLRFSYFNSILNKIKHTYPFCPDTTLSFFKVNKIKNNKLPRMPGKKRSTALFDDDEEEFIFCATSILKRERKFLRKIWDSDYFLELAELEGSLIAEYRSDPEGFDMLGNLLSSKLSRVHRQAVNALGGSGTAKSQGVPIHTISPTGLNGDRHLFLQLLLRLVRRKIHIQEQLYA
jgi:hypothetical protein